jgi:MoxR-like ATPase
MSRVRAAGAEDGLLEIEEFQRVAVAIREQVASVIVGQPEAVDGVLTCLIAGGHALLEGIPGVGKTSLVRAFAGTLDLAFGRIQFTPDLMPADITGTNVLAHDAGGPARVSFQAGPVFANLLLADEINRATPKTQSALLEAMQEGTVTIANATRPLPQPFCVLATENPIEMQGTYPLPEAQLDRFLLQLAFRFPALDDLTEIIYRTAEGVEPKTERVADAATLLRMNQLTRAVPMAPHVVNYGARLLMALRPESPEAPAIVTDRVRLGPSPRGLQALCLAGRVSALLGGRPALAFRDIREVAHAALRHRLVLSFDAQREGISPDAVIDAAIGVIRESPD